MATVTERNDTNQNRTPTRQLPQVSPRLLYWFDWYLRRYIPKHFHALAVNNGAAAASIDASEPLIVYMNHASWWDPLVALLLAKSYFPSRKLFAPIDAVAVQKYPFMQRLGFFPVEQNRLHGAGEFLKTARAILHHRDTSVWLTPEGKFVDPREQNIAFQPGLAHLVSKLKNGVVLPLAVEYPFWEERMPEALCRFGEAIHIAEHQAVGKENWQQILESKLRDTQKQLESASLARMSDEFEVLLSGQTGVVWMYDILRRIRSLLVGTKLDQAHGDKLR